MSDNSVPAAPDYSPMINAFNAIAQHASTQGQAAYDWAKGQVAGNQNLIDQVNKGNLDTDSTFSGAANKSLQRGEGAIDDATGYLRNERSRYQDPTRVASDMGASEANVGQAFDAARNSSIQSLESFGVNPGATRFAGLDAGIRTQEAAAKAAAGTTAARQDEALADQANDKILGQGNTDTTTSNVLQGTGTNAGTTAVANNLGGTASGANVLGTDLAWTGANSGAVGGAANTTNQGFQNSLDSAKANQSASSGIGSLLGTGAALGLKALALKDGGAIPDPRRGGEIPMSASPSGGAVTDDIPANAPGTPNIRLNGGETIIPRDVTKFLGDKFFLDMIAKARKTMGAGAVPDQRQQQPAVG